MATKPKKTTKKRAPKSNPVADMQAHKERRAKTMEEDRASILTDVEALHEKILKITSRSSGPIVALFHACKGYLRSQGRNA